MMSKNGVLAIVVAVLVSLPFPMAFSQESPAAARLLQDAGFTGGVCCVLGAGDGAIALAIASHEHWAVHVLDPDPAAVQRLRESAAARGIFQPRLVAEQWPNTSLPYAENLVDMLVALDAAPGVVTDALRAEALRALRPGGKAYFPGGTADAPWSVVVKPEPEGMDDWTHWEHGPDNNPVSTDQVVRAPYMTQWLGLPYYIAMPAITLAAGGRTFLAMGHIAHHEREEAWLNTLLARNGYNGQELWRKKLPDGYLVHRSAFIATDDTFLMIDLDGQGCLLLDPESGREKDRVRLDDHPGYWKWMAMVEGILFVLVGDEPDPNQLTVVRSEKPAWSWEELSTGYYEEQIPWGFGNTLLAINLNDLDRKPVMWSHSEESGIDSRAMAFGDGRLFYYVPEKRLGCLDSGTGTVLWTNEEPEVRALIEEQGVGLESTPGFRTACLSVYTPGELFYQGQTKANLVAVSTDTGKMMWHRNKTTNNPNVIYVDGKVLAGIGEEGSTFVLDPATGEIIEDLGFKKRSCVRLTATPDSLFVRGWPEGLTRFDRNSKRIFFDGSVRPGCNDGVIGANGLLYIGPWLCDCNLSLMGTVTLSSAGDFDPATHSGERVYLADNPSPAEPMNLDVADWAVYRGGLAHAAASSATVEAALMPLWTWKRDGDEHRGSTFLPTAATSAGGLVFVAGNDGVIRGIDAATGEQRWEYATAGPIIHSPTANDGRVFAGSADGYVYAIDASTGRLLWRFRAAPVERRTMVYGAIGSIWPVNSGVVVKDGVAYFAAGIIDYDGTYVYAVDAATGELKWVNNTSGYLDRELRKGASAQGGLTIHDGKLWMAGGNVVGLAAYDLETGDYVGEKDAGDGSPQNNRGEEVGLFAEKYLISGGRLRHSAADNVVNPGSFQVACAENRQLGISLGSVAPAWDDTLLVALPNREAPPAGYDAVEIAARCGKESPRMPGALWHARGLDGSRVEAVALAQDGVAIACSSPRFRSLAPRYRLCVLGRDSGDLLWENDLPGKPCLNGITIDRDGRILVALEDGRIAAYGDYDALLASFDGLSAMAAAGDIKRERVTKRLYEALSNVHEMGGRNALLTRLSSLGETPFAEASANGAVCRWHLLGPVPWDDDKYPTDRKIIHEPRVKLDRTRHIDGKEFSWREYITVERSGFVDLNAIFGPLERKAVYAYAEVDLPQDGTYTLAVGTNDGFKCWFNDTEVGRHDTGRRYMPDQDLLSVTAKQGTNRVLLKVLQEGGAWALGVRVLDANGAPVPQE